MRTLLACLLAALLLPAAASARVSLGAYGNTDRFDRLTGQQTESGLTYLAWDQGRTWGSPYSYFLERLGDRPHIALKTAKNGGITPQGIAQGKGDAHLIGLATAIAESAKPTIIRPLAEMNNERNPYCAFFANGRREGRGITTRWYRKAFQRIYIVMHGGSAQAMTARLRRVGLPGIKADVPASSPRKLTVVFNPLAVGVPESPATTTATTSRARSTSTPTGTTTTTRAASTRSTEPRSSTGPIPGSRTTSRSGA